MAEHLTNIKVEIHFMADLIGLKQCGYHIEVDHMQECPVNHSLIAEAGA